MSTEQLGLQCILAMDPNNSWDGVVERPEGQLAWLTIELCSSFLAVKFSLKVSYIGFGHSRACFGFAWPSFGSQTQHRLFMDATTLTPSKIQENLSESSNSSQHTGNPVLLIQD